MTKHDLEKDSDLEKIANHPMPYGFFFKNVLPVIKGQRDRSDALEKRLESLEAQPAALDYKGVWSEQHARANGYRRNEGVTLGGSLWVCKTIYATSRPGSGSNEWQLAVKKNRAGELDR